MDRAEQMREAAAVECQRIADEAKGYGIPQMAMGANTCRDAIRALPLPPQPPLADDVAGVVAECKYVADEVEAACDKAGPRGIQAETDDGRRMVAALRAAADLIERLAGERDRQYDENVNRIVKEAAANARAEKAEAEVARLREAGLKSLQALVSARNYIRQASGTSNPLRDEMIAEWCKLLGVDVEENHG